MLCVLFTGFNHSTAFSQLLYGFCELFAASDCAALIGLLVGYEANKKKGDTASPPTPVTPVAPVPPKTPITPETNARVVGDDDGEAAGSADFCLSQGVRK